MGGGKERWEGGGSMHLWRTVGKGHFSLHASAPAVCSLLLRAFMSKRGDSVRRTFRGENVESPRGQDEEEEKVGGRKGHRSVDASQCELNPQYSHI